MATEKKSVNISAENLLALIEKYGEDKVFSLSDPKKDRVFRFYVNFLDPDTKHVYKKVDMNDTTYGIKSKDKGREFGPQLSFSGGKPFGKVSGIIENWCIRKMCKEVEDDDPDGDGKIKVWKLDNKQLRKYDYFDKDKKKKEKVKHLGNDKVNRKFQSSINSADASEEDKKEFEGIYRVNVDMNDKGLPRNDFFDMSNPTIVEKTIKGKKVERVQLPSLNFTDDTIHEVITAGSEVKGPVTYQFVVSSQGGSVKCDYFSLYVRPAEKADQIENDLGDDMIAELLAVAKNKQAESESKPQDDGSDDDGSDDDGDDSDGKGDLGDDSD